MKFFSFVETPEFTKKIVKLLTDEEFAAFQIFLCENPDFGKLIKGSGGIRKVRWMSGGKGKSGGIRVLYYLINDDGKILFLDVYSKNERETITDDEIKQLRSVVEGFRQ
jgi:mRNA-degrading endonuclease RelE of RelBE toxin-antitoxin system